jgi:hypothetical protein
MIYGQAITVGHIAARRVPESRVEDEHRASGTFDIHARGVEELLPGTPGPLVGAGHDKRSTVLRCEGVDGKHRIY